jgi:hypothetical protein
MCVCVCVVCVCVCVCGMCVCGMCVYSWMWTMFLFECTLVYHCSKLEGGKVAGLTHQPPLLIRKYSWYSFLLEAESTPGPLCSRKDYVMKNSSDTIGNRTRNFPACSAVPQPTVPPRAPCILLRTSLSFMYDKLDPKQLNLFPLQISPLY